SRRKQMIRGLFVSVDPTAPVESRELGRLEDYQEAVGGWIEPVDIPSLGTTIYVNEEGLIRQLPFNPRATFLWWFHVPSARAVSALFGPALLVGMPDARGDSADVPEPVVKLSAPNQLWRIEYLTESDARWRQGDVGHRDAFEAMVWGMALMERSPEVMNIRLAPLESLPSSA
ncbi:MAG: DUF3846 domain-containing protein, partial [Cumulibacter sp.]